MCYEPGINQLPDYNGGQFYDVISKLLGWRVRAEYAPYPANFLNVTILTDQFPAPLTPLPVIDELERDGGEFGVRFVEAEKKDFGFQYRNNVGEEPLNPTLAVQQSLAIYAAPTSKLAADGEGRNRDLHRVPVYLVEEDNAVNGSGTEANFQPDPTEHPNYLESVLWTRPAIKDQDRVYICAIEDIPVTGKRAVLSRAPNAPGTGQIGQTAEHWALELLKKLRDSDFNTNSVGRRSTHGHPAKHTSDCR